MLLKGRYLLLSVFRCSAIVERFMQLDLEKDDAVSFLKDFVIPASEGLA